jgi:hypothetical protein
METADPKEFSNDRSVLSLQLRHTKFVYSFGEAMVLCNRVAFSVFL